MGIIFFKNAIFKNEQIFREKWCRSEKPEDFFEQIVLKKGSLFADKV